MKFLTIISILLLGSCSADSELWKNFKDTHGKVYSTEAEETKRYEIFQQSLKTIEEHNVKYENGQTTYYLSINKFSDLTTEELERYLTKIEYPPQYKRRESKKVYEINDVPDTVDWREKNVVTSVKDQISCGCCYAFASIAAVESAYAIAGKGLIDLSVQQLIDCSYGDTYLNYGCYGGIIEGSIHYVMDHGIQSWDDYPYESRVKHCTANSSLSAATASAYENVPEDEILLKNAVAGIAPVAACLDVSSLFSYEGGIYDSPCYDKATNHVILIVGYGTENGVDYWLCKNSWGPTWGLDGYFKVRRNHENSACISTYTAYAII